MTHSKGFHADDVTAYAILKEVLTKRGESWKLKRTRDQDEINSADIVFDTGGLYDPEKNRYDHHQRGRAGARPNGVLYASAGLIWKHFGPEICPNEKVWSLIDKTIIQEIDAGDSGQDYIGPLQFPDCGYTSLTIHIARFEPTMFQDKNPEILLKSFEEASEFMREILRRAIHDQEALTRAFDEASEIYRNSTDKQILVYEKNYERPTWKLLAEYPEPLFAIYRNDKDSDFPNDWRAEAVPITPIIMTSRKLFPEAWRGLREDELRTISGVPTARFCHPSGFLVGATTFEGVLELAKKALLM